MTQNRKKIFLLDGTGLVYRAFYAFITRPMTTSRGENTSAIFGFLRVLIQIIRDFKPDSILVAFDLSRDTFRKEIYAEYKAQRQETPRELKEQIPIVIDLLKDMNVPVLEVDGYEADDIIGTFAEKLKKRHEIFIVSSDKDLLQLVDEHVLAIRPQKGISEVNQLDRNGVKETLGVWPEQIVDFLAIVGDTSDNIPGVKGIGEKGALQLLSSYQTLDKIYEHIEEIKGAMKTKLIEQKDNAYLSRTLAMIKLDMDLDEKILEAQLEKEKLLNSEVTKKLEHYQIASVIGDLKKLINAGTIEKQETGLFAEEAVKATATEELKGNYRLITSKNELNSLIENIQRSKLLSIDTETTSARPVDADLIGISVSLNEGEGVFIPFLYPAGQEFDRNFVIEKFQAVLEDESIRKIGQNTKYEKEIFKNIGIEMRGVYFDTMLAAYLLNPVRTHNNLESLVQEYLGLKKKEYKEVLKDILKKDKTLLDAPIEDVVHYACGDSDAALRLKNKLEPLLKKAGLDNVFSNIEIPLVHVLAVMEQNGVKLDTAYLEKLSKELDSSIRELEEKIYHLAGKEFNINSPIQLSRILFEELKLEPVKKTDSGKASTDEEVLGILAAVHPLPAEILKYRTYAKLKGTYVDALPLLISPRTGRIHTSFNQTITATGRLSSSDPNLQNIPVRDEIGRKIREAFIADEGKILISADYSQIELRVLAHFCGDENMKKAFSDGLDIHRHTAALVFGIPEKEVTEEMRRRAKSVNFGIIYGLQAYGLSRQLGIPMGEAKEFINNYFNSFPKVRAFVEKVLEEAMDTGEVRTMSGRYRRFPDLMGKEIKQGGPLGASQRMALNSKIQGTAADIIKMAMIKLQQYLEENKMESKLILQIHDELVVEAPAGEAEKIKEVMKAIMEKTVILDVPLDVDAGTGKNWSEAH